MILYDAPRCPYCARARIVLAEGGIDYETVVVDLDDRPSWIYEKNPTGKVPVLEEEGFVLPESTVIMEYLDESRKLGLLPQEPRARALARVWIDRFDQRLGDVYYAVRRRDLGRGELEAQLRAIDGALASQPYLTGSEYGVADIAYAPWVIRSGAMLGVDLEQFETLSKWLERLEERPAVAAEIDVVAALVR